MPKILINEEDFTTPGTPDSYANYSVLITGFIGDGDGITVKPDSNGVYEFNSAGDFEKTIGIVSTVEQTDTEQNVKVYHYGNQMAHSLLKLGYTVIYKPINTVLPETNKAGEEILEGSFFNIFNDTFWEPFKDKASYDFRFVSHGLLNSSASLSDNDDYQEASNNFDTADEDLATIEVAIAELDRIKAGFRTASAADSTLDEETFCNNWYCYGEAYAQNPTDENKVEAYYSNFEGFRTSGTDTGYYLTFSDAETGTSSAKKAREDDLANYKEAMTQISRYLLTTDKINTANTCIANLAKYVADDATPVPGRGDCIALIELDENSYTNTASADKPEIQIISAIQALSTAIGDMSGCGKYCALTVPSVYYNDGRKFPGGFHYLSCFINSLRQDFREWYAAAGYTRGVSSYVIERTSVDLGEIAINALEPRQKRVDGQFACNVIANFRGSYYLWGNRTAHPLDDSDLTASSFLNIRQLCTTIKKQLYVACRRFTFDPNSDTLWFNFVNAIKPTLEAMKADQGVRDYKIIKVTTDKKATLKAKIRIIPIEAVEDFDLTVSLEDSFGETTAVITE